jgi:hypothetical protein
VSFHFPIRAWARGALWLCLALGFQVYSARATLIIHIWHGEEVYVASDSLTTMMDSSKTVTGGHFTSIKTFQLSSTCRACISGWDGIQRRGRRPGEYATPSLIESLEHVCGELRTSKEPLQSKMSNVVNTLSREFTSDLELRRKRMPPASLGGFTTYVCFAGYDDSRKAFFLSEFELSATNPAVVSTGLRLNSTFDREWLVAQGETTFLGALKKDDPKAVSLLSADGKTTLRDIRSPDGVVPQTQMVGLILELFRLHKEHAAEFPPDQGRIGEPYVIFKITRTNMSQVY